ncbi:MAG: hypothetical protein HY904_04845 [Deltaproteobacteria bacterium]|nr:hypothetical protein [Deltaproteobacteria bacterium]
MLNTSCWAPRALAALVLLAPAGASADENSEKAAADLLERRMRNTRPEDWNLLKAVEGRQIVVVRGSMDHIEQVLTAARIRHTVIEPEQVAKADLNADQIVMVDCPGYMPDAGVRRLERFVRAGGLLYTTDWALLNVVQKAFPRTIRHNGGSTGDHVTAVQVGEHDDNLMSNMLLSKGGQPQWWLEGGSYPIEILDKKRVTVLASSEQMRRKYGSAPVVVRFRWEDGEVVHVVSHFYRQMATQGPSTDVKAGVASVEGLTEEDKKEFQAAAPAARMSDVESSYAFQQMTTNLVVGKGKANKDLDKSYGVTPKASVSVEGRTVKSGDRLKVLEKKGAKVRVRDDRGNEAELDEAQLQAR